MCFLICSFVMKYGAPTAIESSLLNAAYGARLAVVHVSMPYLMPRIMIVLNILNLTFKFHLLFLFIVANIIVLAAGLL